MFDGNLGRVQYRKGVIHPKLLTNGAISYLQFKFSVDLISFNYMMSMVGGGGISVIESIPRISGLIVRYLPCNTEVHLYCPTFP